MYRVSNNKFIVIPEGDYKSIYLNDASKNDSRSKLGLNHEDFILLYLGFIKPYKGIEELIISFKKNKLPNQSLLIAGRAMDQNYFRKIEKLALSLTVVLR